MLDSQKGFVFLQDCVGVLGFCDLLKLFIKYRLRICTAEYRWGHLCYADLKERTKFALFLGSVILLNGQ